ncbi:MAG: radical SAM protein [bacterium]
MRVLFMEADTEARWSVASLGPGYLAAWLRRAGHTVIFQRVRHDQPVEQVVEQARGARPDLIGFSLTTRQWHRVRALAAALRPGLGVPIIAGGLHPTFAPEEVLAAPGFDFVCLGEGEAPLLELVEALERGEVPMGIPNIWVKGHIRPPVRPPFEPIDALPFMARDLLDEHHGVVHLTTQRGCPFPCTYCAARMYNALYAESGEDYGRRRSAQNVLDELFGLKRAGQLAYVIFLDDTFTIHHPWVRDFCEVYGRELKVPFSINARVETVNPTLLRQLADAGCKHVIYGVESGSYRIRKEIMRRPVKNERFVEVFDWTRDAGMMVTANYMLGLPDETRDDLEQTLALAEQLDAYDFGYFVFYPYPGTPLYQTCKERGLLPDDFLDRPANHRASVLRLEHLTQADIGEFYDRFTALRERQHLKHQPGSNAFARARIREQIQLHARHA